MFTKAIVICALFIGAPIPALAQSGSMPAEPQRSNASRSGPDQVSRPSNQMQSGDPSSGPVDRRPKRDPARSSRK